AAASRATAARALFARLSLVDGQRTTAVVLAVLGGDRGLRLGVAAHFHESEALAATGVTVGDDLRALHGAVLGEELLQRRAIDVVAHVSDIQLLAHDLLLR